MVRLGTGSPGAGLAALWGFGRRGGREVGEAFTLTRVSGEASELEVVGEVVYKDEVQSTGWGLGIVGPSLRQGPRMGSKCGEGAEASLGQEESRV